MKEIKYVVFDYNGTITDDAEIALESCNKVLKNLYGLPEISLKRFRETFQTPWINFFVLNGVKKEDIDIETHQKHYREAHTSLAKKRLKIRKFAKENLQFLKQKGLKLGVLSSRNIEDLTNELKQIEVYNLFDAIIGEENIQNDGTKAEKKTNKLIKALKITENKKVLYIGDITKDIDVAKEAGFISGVITGGWQSATRLKEKNPDYIFNSHKEIKELFK